MLLKCFTQYVSKFGKLRSGLRKRVEKVRTGKMSVFIPIPKKGNAKECSNYHTVALISHASKVMLKILQARLQQNVNHKYPDFQLDLEEPKIKLPTSTGSSEKHESSRKTFASALLTMPKPLTMWITTHWKFWRNTRPPHLPPEKSV